MIKKWTTIFITIILSFLVWIHSIDSIAYAQPFPEREGLHVLDPADQFKQPEKTNLRDYITSLSHEYVVVFLDKLEEDGFDYTKELFEHYELGTNSLLFVVATAEPSPLFYAYGSDIANKGLTDQIIKEREETLFKPYIREQDLVTGMSQLINSLELELENLDKQKARDAQITIQDPTDQEEAEDKSSSNLPWWIILLSVLFLLIVFTIIFSFFYRRKITRQVDQLEAWKIEIENRPFSTQLARVKGLRLAGETETQFEKWKAEWEEILNTTLPEIEETLIDIEEEADRYCFIGCKKMLLAANGRLEEIESSLDNIVKEIDELTSNEKNNRDKVAKLHEQYQELKSSLHKNSLVLGISYPVWFEKFKTTTEWFDQYNRAQEGGDYLQAKDMLEAIESVFKQINEAIDLTPNLINQIEQEVPAQLKDVELAIQEMKEKGYQIEHTGVENRLKEVSTKKHEVVSYMEKGQVKNMQSWLEHLTQEIETIYTSLEEEVEAKAYVLSMMDHVSSYTDKLKERYEHVVYESSKTKQSYAWEREWEEELSSIKKEFQEIEVIAERLHIPKEEVPQQYPTLKPEIVLFEEKRELLLQALKSFEENLSQLRDEELQAIELLKRMKQTIIKIKVNLRKSNLPGVPDHLLSGLTIADEAIGELESKLAEVPVHMHKIQHQLQETRTQVESVSQVAKSVIAQAKRAEQLIQIANRFRRSNEEVRMLLMDAEDAFRKLQFREAVELAEEALDLGDKKWREKLGDDEDFAV